MDANSLVLGGPEGLVGMASRLGQTEADRRERHRADLMELMERLKKAKAAEARAAQMHPLEMEAKRLGNIKAQLEGKRAEHDLGLEQMYGAKKREVDIGKTVADTKGKTLENIKAEGLQFLEELGKSAGTGGIITDEDLDRNAAFLGEGYQNHPLYQQLRRLPPDSRGKAIKGAQLGTTASVMDREKQREMMNRAEMQENARTDRAVRVQAMKNAQSAQNAAAKAAAAGTPKTFQHMIIKLQQAALAAAGDEGKQAQIVAQLQHYEDLIARAQAGWELVQNTDGSWGIGKQKTSNPAATLPGAVGTGTLSNNRQPIYARNKEGKRIMSTDGGQTWTDAQ